MNDDLVKRLRNPPFGTETSERNVMNEAADRIEQDAQHIDEMYGLVAAMNADHTASKTRIEKLEAALREIDGIVMGGLHLPMTTLNDVSRIARKALEEKDG
jgi:hypothetical protein